MFEGWRAHSGLMLVKNDTFRTLATDKEFKGKVDEEMLIRLLEAFIWKSKGTMVRAHV